MSMKDAKQILGTAFTLLSGVTPEAAKTMKNMLFECNDCNGTGRKSNGRVCDLCKGTGELFN